MDLRNNVDESVPHSLLALAVLDRAGVDPAGQFFHHDGDRVIHHAIYAGSRNAIRLKRLMNGIFLIHVDGREIVRLAYGAAHIERQPFAIAIDDRTPTGPPAGLSVQRFHMAPTTSEKRRVGKE